MLAEPSEIRANAGMSKPVKRRRVVASKTSSTGITIVQKADAQGYVYHVVQGWKENGKWQRKRYKERSDAETFAAELRVKFENKGRAQQLVLSPLSEEQLEEALQASDKLGSTYRLTEAVSFFLRHHRPPEFTIRLADAVQLYLEDKGRDGLRPRTVHGIGWTLGLFNTATDNPWTHEVTGQQVDSFLRGLRAKNKKDKASLRSWEIHRGALHGFFVWASKADAGSNRPFTFSNPVESIRKFSSRQVREEQDAKPTTTSVADVRRLFSVLMRWRGGLLVRHYAYLYFAGLRPDELKRLAGLRPDQLERKDHLSAAERKRLASREPELVNLKTRTITIPANISKTRHERQVTIPENLAAWLDAFPGDLIPPNFENLNKKVRKHFELSHDEARHSFISYHVALHRSVGDAALQAGNSENVVKRHYLNTHPQKEGDEFFRVIPDKQNRRAVLAKPVKKTKSVLRAV
jgi:hypothetical protein